MNDDPGGRPPAVTVIGWTYVLAGIATFASAWAGLAGWWAVVGLRRTELLHAPPDAPPPLVWLSRVFVVFDVLALVQIAAGVLAMLAGAQFLRLRAWTRPVLEALAWIALLGAIGFGVLWIYAWLAMSARMPAAFGLPQRLAAFMGLLAGTAIVVLLALPVAVMIKVLRGTTVKQALAREPR